MGDFDELTHQEYQDHLNAIIDSLKKGWNCGGKRVEKVARKILKILWRLNKNLNNATKYEECERLYNTAVEKIINIVGYYPDPEQQEVKVEKFVSGFLGSVGEWKEVYMPLEDVVMACED